MLNTSARNRIGILLVHCMLNLQKALKFAEADSSNSNHQAQSGAVIFLQPVALIRCLTQLKQWAPPTTGRSVTVIRCASAVTGHNSILHM